MYDNLLISFIEAGTFGFVDILNIYIVEDTVRPFLKKNTNLDVNEEVLTIMCGSIAIISSIIVDTFLEKYLSAKYKFTRTPFLSVLGIIIGTIFFLFLFKLYYRLRKAYIKISHLAKKEERYIH